MENDELLKQIEELKKELITMKEENNKIKSTTNKEIEVIKELHEKQNKENLEYIAKLQKNKLDKILSEGKKVDVIEEENKVVTFDDICKDLESEF